MSTIGFIGGGNITSAILTGAETSKDFDVREAAIYDIDAKVCGDYRERGYHICQSITALVDDCSIVVLAVKPQMIETVMPEVRAAMTPGKILVSVAAGIGIDWITSQAGTAKVVRCMPNTPAQMGMGAIALSRSTGIDNRDFVAVRRFFERCGIVEEIPEAMMCVVTAINGSTPAFFYRMAHVIVEEAVAMGFEETAAMRLLAQTMKGSAQMLLSSGLGADILEKKVCSPGGTTLAGLAAMDEAGFNQCLTNGMRACVKRCEEMSR